MAGPYAFCVSHYDYRRYPGFIRIATNSIQSNKSVYCNCRGCTRVFYDGTKTKWLWIKPSAGFLAQNIKQ